MADTLHTWISSPLFLLTLTVACYYGSLLLWRKTGWVILHPILVSITVIMAFLKLTGISFESYYRANAIINFLLGVSVVALGYLLHDNLSRIKGRELSILLSLFAGSLVGVLSVTLLSMLFGIDHTLILSIQPKSVTMPIALEVSSLSGGVPPITTLSVIITGIFGSVVGPWMLEKLRITDPVARGLALGAASHAVGTARALQMGAVEGAVGGAAIGIMGVMTAVIVPLVNLLL